MIMSRVGWNDYCWFCDEKDHQVQECPPFIAMLKFKLNVFDTINQHYEHVQQFTKIQ